MRRYEKEGAGSHPVPPRSSGKSEKAQHSKRIQQMFNTIACRYDFLNHLLSGFLDVRWRHRAISLVNVPPGGWVLDVATGTGDLATEVARQASPNVRVVGLDFSWIMLHLARGKFAGGRWVAAAAESMPFRAEAFDAALIAFGIRNLPDLSQGLREIHRVIRPGGKLLVLELTMPPGRYIGAVYRLYAQYILPFVASLFSRRSAYRYLTRSVEEFPSQEEFAELMRKASYEEVVYHLLSGGVATIFVGVKG